MESTLYHQNKSKTIPDPVYLLSIDVIQYTSNRKREKKKKTRGFSASFSSEINPTPPLLRKITNNTKNRSLKNDEKKKTATKKRKY